MVGKEGGRERQRLGGQKKRELEGTEGGSEGADLIDITTECMDNG